MANSAILSAWELCNCTSTLLDATDSSRERCCKRQQPDGERSQNPQERRQAGNLLGRRLSARATNSARPGYDLWRSRHGAAAPRWSSGGRACHGGLPKRPRHPLAPHCRRRRPDPHSGAACFAATPPAGKRRHAGLRVARKFASTHLESRSSKSRCAQKAQSSCLSFGVIYRRLEHE
jgi:hypothetical protein